MPIVPPDPRALPTFEIIRGEETMFRRDYTPADPHGSSFGDLPSEVLVGQPVRFLGTNDKVFIINDTDVERTDTVVHHVVGTIHPTIGGSDYEEQLAGISFTHYTSTLAGGGEPSAVENAKIVVVSGHFIARLKTATWFKGTPVTGMGVEVMNDASGSPDVALYRGVDRDAQANLVAAALDTAAGAYAVAKYANCIGKVINVEGDYTVVEFNF